MKLLVWLQHKQQTVVDLPAGGAALEAQAALTLQSLLTLGSLIQSTKETLPDSAT